MGVQGEEEEVHEGAEGWEGEEVIRAVVRFDDGVPDDVQAKCLFDFEISLRKLTGSDVRVFKERMADDSKLRVVMDKRRQSNFNVPSAAPVGTSTVWPE